MDSALSILAQTINRPPSPQHGNRLGSGQPGRTVWGPKHAGTGELGTAAGLGSK